MRMVAFPASCLECFSCEGESSIFAHYESSIVASCLGCLTEKKLDAASFKEMRTVLYESGFPHPNKICGVL